ADGYRAEFSCKNQRQHREFGPGIVNRRRSRKNDLVDPLGRGYGHGLVDWKAYSRDARMDHPQFAGAYRDRPYLPSVGKSRWARRATHLGNLPRHTDRTGGAG